MKPLTAIPGFPESAASPGSSSLARWPRWTPGHPPAGPCRISWTASPPKLPESSATLSANPAKFRGRLIAGATDELLRARETLRTHPVVVAADPAESSRVLELVAEAQDVQQLTPEGAVAQGIALGGDVTEFAKGADLTTFRPQSIADAGAIADALRAGNNVLVDLAQLPAADAQRIREFMDGATRVRGGMVERVDDMQYRAMPATPNQREWAISATRGTLADLAPARYRSRRMMPDGAH